MTNQEYAHLVVTTHQQELMGPGDWFGIPALIARLFGN